MSTAGGSLRVLCGSPQIIRINIITSSGAASLFLSPRSTHHNIARALAPGSLRDRCMRVISYNSSKRSLKRSWFGESRRWIEPIANHLWQGRLLLYYIYSIHFFQSFDIRTLKRKMSSKSVTVLLEKNQKLKNILKKCYCLFLKKSKKLKMVSRFYGSFRKKWQTKKSLQKALRFFFKKIKHWKISSKCYGPSRKRRKTAKWPKRVTALHEKKLNIVKKLYDFSWERNKKLKNVFKERYGPSWKTIKNWKMSSKSVMVLFERKIKILKMFWKSITLLCKKKW